MTLVRAYRPWEGRQLRRLGDSGGMLREEYAIWATFHGAFHGASNIELISR
jgi:hypothetical protein